MNLQILPEPRDEAPARRFRLRTFGCQMNVHDSEKIENLLLHHGWSRAESDDDAALLIVNTCSIREKAEHKLYSDLGLLRAWKEERAGRVVGVGGCVAQQEGDALLARFPQLDFVFGTHNLRLVPALADAARAGSRAARVDESRSLDRFDLPERHPAFAGTTAGRAFVTVMEGCDMFCSFCIVPRTRGREISRPAASIVAEALALARAGIREITLLGQTVNAYGRHEARHDVRRGAAPHAETEPFASLLRRLARIPGIERIRYTSSHPVFFDPALVRAHGDLEALCPHVHLPVQSGSDAVLARMRRRHGREAYLEIVRALRRARPGIAITSDLIVGFPGETDPEFEATLALMREAELVDSFSFKYSPRPGTGAAELGDAVPEDVKQQRLEALQALQRELTLRAHRRRVGEETDVLLAGPSRRGGGQLSGRDPQQRVVNLVWPPGRTAPRPGTMVRVRIVEATPHSLLAEPAGAPAVAS